MKKLSVLLEGWFYTAHPEAYSLIADFSVSHAMEPVYYEPGYILSKLRRQAQADAVKLRARREWMCGR